MFLHLGPRRRALLSGALAAAALLVALEASAQVQLVADIDTSGEPRVFYDFYFPHELFGGLPDQLTEVAGRLVFVAADATHGFEPWASEGPAQGARMLADICPGSCSSEVMVLGSTGRKVYFLASAPATGHELWVTDGTASGTRLVRDVYPGPVGQRLYDNTALIVGESLYFPAYGLGTGRQVWVSDGTMAGTRAVTALPGGSGVELGLVGFVRGRLVFGRSHQSANELWSTDGTPSGTVLLESFDSTFFAPGVVHRGGLYFTAGNSLYRTDGTEGSVVEVHRFNPNQYPVLLGLAAGQLFFFLNEFTPGGILNPLWVSDGTTVGTRLVHPFSRIEDVELLPDQLVLAARVAPAEPLGLWTTNGRPEETRRRTPHALPWDLLLAQHRSVFSYSVLGAVGRSVYFSGCADDGTGCEPRRLDLDTDEEVLLADLVPGADSSMPARFTAIGDTVYFSASEPAVHDELWAFTPEPPAPPPPRCVPAPDRLCLQDGRFEVRARFADPRLDGTLAVAQAAGLSEEAGTFWFFTASATELMVKVLDGRSVNGGFWVFWNALSDLTYEVEVRDVTTGRSRLYREEGGDLCGGADTATFDAPEEVGTGTLLRASGPLGSVRAGVKQSFPCLATTSQLCLLGGRVQGQVRWRIPATGETGLAEGIRADDHTAMLSFFAPGNLEMVLKVLDGEAVNGRLWVFWAALSDLEYTLELVDLATGTSWTRTAAGGAVCGGADVEALGLGSATSSD